MPRIVVTASLVAEWCKALADKCDEEWESLIRAEREGGRTIHAALLEANPQSFALPQAAQELRTFAEGLPFCAGHFQIELEEDADQGEVTPTGIPSEL